MKFLGHLGLESRCFLAAGIATGIAAIAFIPPVVTFDGPSHYLRALQIAEGGFRSTRYSETKLGGEIPERDGQFVHALWSSYWEQHNFQKISDWSQDANHAGGSLSESREEFTNTAVYSPVNYLPQCVGMYVSRIFTRSPLWTHYVACTANLLTYISLIVLILEVIPHFRSSLLIVASSPLLLIQASTESTDALNFALPMLAFALVWKTHCNPTEDHRVTLVALSALSIVLALLKPVDVACLGVLCFIPKPCFESGRHKAVYLTCTLAVAFATWSFWNGAYLDVNIAGWFFPGHPPASAQKAWLREHPGDFLRAIRTFMRNDFSVQWGLFYGGVGGWISFGLLTFLLKLSRWSLAILLLMPLCEGKRDLRWSVVSGLQAACLLLVIALTLWVGFGIGDAGNIPFLGGRYLSSVYTFLLVAWSSLVSGCLQGGRKLLIACGLAANAVGVGSILISTAMKTAG